MKTLVRKSRALGPSTISLAEPTVQLGHFLFEVSVIPLCLRRKRYLAVLICEIAIVEYFKSTVTEAQETVNVPVLHKRLADVVDLSSFVMAFGVRQKQDIREETRSGADVNNDSVWSLPNGMELCFDEDAGHLPDSPARQLNATMCGNMLWNNAETFTKWLSKQGHAVNRIGLGPSSN